MTTPPMPPMPPALPSGQVPGPPAPVYVPAGPPRPTGPQPAYAQTKSGPGYPVRGLWFVLVGWWLAGIVSTVAWVAMITIIGLPLGIWMINRLPTVLTLRPRTSYSYAYLDASGAVRTGQIGLEQVAWPLRGLWFVFVGWWASAFVIGIAYVLVVLLITLPIGLWIFNRVPFVASLYRY